jgi:hypothetical protein
MKRLLALTLFALLAIGCFHRNGFGGSSSKESTMTYTAGTQAELDAANQRVNQYRQELMRQGFHEISASLTTSSGDSSNSQERFVLEGQYGRLKNLQVTFWTTKQIEKDQPHVRGGVHASIVDNEADRDFETLYKKVCFVVTGHDR